MRKEKVLKGPHKRMCIIVGAQRAGSTYLLKVLGEHPEISIQRPTQPEPKFFFVEDEYEKGIEYYERKFFSHGKEKDVWVEKSVSYYEEGTGTVARRIKEAYPNCRILFILRDPTQRALSNYFYSRKNGLEDRTLKEVFLDEIPPNKNPLGTSVSPFNYMRRGEYEKFIKVFRDKQV